MEQQSGIHGRRGDGGTHLHVMTMEQVSAEMQRCIGHCTDCHTSCRDTITHCLTTGGKHAEPEHIWLLADCAEICQTSAHFMMHNSPMHHVTCRACADVCSRCAEECEQFADDRQMQACADACRRCAESCRRMAAMSQEREPMGGKPA